jgi:nucleoid-associated protein YgaU
MKAYQSPSIVARGGFLLAVILWIVAAVLVRSATIGSWDAVHRPASGVDDGVALLAGVAGLLVLGWLAVATILAAIAELSPPGTRVARGSRHLADRYAPAVLRHGVAVVVGAALLGGVAPANAAPPQRPPGVSAAADLGIGHGLDPGWAPTPGQPWAPPLDPSWAATGPAWIAGRPSAGRDVVIAQSTSASTSAPTSPIGPERQPELDPQWGSPSRRRAGALPETAMTVRRGDTLWDIAARHLGPAATDLEIAHAWPQWFAANRTVIGPNPDRLHPGQRLSPPA